MAGRRLSPAEAASQPPAPAPDAPVLREGRPDWLLRHLGGDFTVLARDTAPATSLRAVTLGHDIEDHSGLAAARLGLAPGEALLLRPDQHIAARFGADDAPAIAAAHRAALCA